MSGRGELTGVWVFSLITLALALFGMWLLSLAHPTFELREEDWRCVARDVESGRCDVYERRERAREETP